MRIIRTFHPIGQGAFYSERFYDDTQHDATHNMVYDCGVSFGNEWKMNHVVTQAFTPEDEIDYLFISHLDYDHVSLVKSLMSRVKDVKKIVLPLVSEEQLIIGMVYYWFVRGEDATADFFEEVIYRLDGVDDNNSSIIFVGGEEVAEEDKHPKATINSGTIVEAPGDDDWVFIPHNVKYRSRRQELIDELEDVTKEQRFVDTINQMGMAPINSGEDLIKKLKEKDFAKDVLTISALRRAIKGAYSRIEGETNGNSLLLYSGPKSIEKGYWLERCEPCRGWRCCDNYRAACLYTGDSACDLKGWKNAKYAGVWNLIGTIQLPHHGSIDSFDVAANQIDRPYVFPVSCGNYNTYGHPSGKVLAYLMVNGCCTPIVTEEAGSVFMQEIWKWRD